MPLKGAQRKMLRSLAHPLKPVVLVGARGLTEQLIGTVESALNDHELIKVKFGEFKEEKKHLAEQIATATHGELIGIIGHIAIVYRPHPDPEKRKIHLP
ncbi:ribosome assembly RNA-binding protein YhbY [Desulfatitalea alkaliphila]|uniref:Ribosome assembly RNA-binding protein YhbY n=1 Tax=Desulfatitalea alkaliphila TaxID=2929485 RepID=A0AA41UMJ7_9BACT|nr:ribosome assembly RNA-binding protein YhbY [Desulfatitalea alkaliphila]MCJ8502681.1 ribosome assembly RNA-binding protein YhbY [Desulfatitalea alkaliphila]